MISVQICGGPVMSLRDVIEGWIAQQVNRRQGDGQQICVKLTIESGSRHMLLASRGCPGVQYCRDLPTRKEQGILDLWTARGTNKPNITAGNVASFLHQFERVV